MAIATGVLHCRNSDQRNHGLLKDWVISTSNQNGVEYSLECQRHTSLTCRWNLIQISLFMYVFSSPCKHLSNTIDHSHVSKGFEFWKGHRMCQSPIEWCYLDVFLVFSDNCWSFNGNNNGNCRPTINHSLKPPPTFISQVSFTILDSINNVAVSSG